MQWKIRSNRWPNQTKWKPHVRQIFIDKTSSQVSRNTWMCVCVCVGRVCRGYEIKIICLCYSYCGAKKVQWSSVEASKKWRIFIALLFSFIWSTSTRLKSHTTWIISSFLFSVCISFRDLHALNSSFKSHPSRNVCVCVHWTKHFLCRSLRHA